VAFLLATAAAQDFKAGVGRVDITFTESVHLGGYASRTAPFKTIGQRIFAKALAIQDSNGQVTLLVSADTIGTPRWFNDRLAERIAQDLKIPREHFLFACSHSHSTPAIKGALENAYGLTGEAAQAVERYSLEFLQKSFLAAQAALTNLEPAKLSFGRGEAHFAANRRQFGKDGVFIGVNPTGVVDNDVPVLRVLRAEPWRAQAEPCAEHLEGAAIAFVRELASEGVESDFARNGVDRARGDEPEARLRIDEPAHEPGGRHPVDRRKSRFRRTACDGGSRRASGTRWRAAARRCYCFRRKSLGIVWQD
jgi:hypothetical protein